MPPRNVRLSSAAAAAAESRWTRIAVGDGRSLLYGARTGRLYLLPRRDAEDPRLQRVLGLARLTFVPDLEDPATSVAHDAASLQHARAGLGHDGAVPPPSRVLRAAYRLIDRTRSVLPFVIAARLVAAAAARKRSRAPLPVFGTGGGIDALARAINALERDVGFADCYPRALLTAYLALSAGAPCRVAIGVLAPTRKMHAWCSVDGVVPYEPMREHYLYRPVLVVSLTR